MGLNSELACQQKKQNGNTLQELISINKLIKSSGFTAATGNESERSSVSAPVDGHTSGESSQSERSFTSNSVGPPSNPRRSVGSGRKMFHRTGGAESFSYSEVTANGATTIIPLACSKRCYRIVGYRKEQNGSFSVIDLLSGDRYNCGSGSSPRVSYNVLVYDSQQAAMSERFPSTQVGAARSGNGTFSRALIALDCWGQCSRRHGGGSSMRVEFAKFMGVSRVLDAPYPISEKQTRKPIDPHNFSVVDQSELAIPTRMRMPAWIKKDRVFF